MKNGIKNSIKGRRYFADNHKGEMMSEEQNLEDLAIEGLNAAIEFEERIKHTMAIVEISDLKKILAAYAALRAKNAELEKRVRELEEAICKHKEDVWGDTEVKHDSDIELYKVIVPPPAEQTPSEPRKEKE